MRNPPDKTLALALLIRRVALMLARLIELWAEMHYSHVVDAPTREE